MHQHYPRLLLNVAKCKANISMMTGKANLNKLAFRPHFKTHQSLTVAGWFRDAGIERITVSSLKMAGYFARGGWDDIFIAFPVNILETEEINRLAGSITLHVSAESLFSATTLAQKLVNKAGVYIKIDTGYHRTGLEPDDTDEISRILEVIDRSTNLTFSGFYTHAGHTYNTNTQQEIEDIYSASRDQLIELKEKYIKDFPGLILSYGDTPSCSILQDFNGLDELRPGNFIFYDMMQQHLGACSGDDIAVALECPVVAKNSKRLELIIHGGAVHLSKESIYLEGIRVYGQVVPLLPAGWGKPLVNTAVVSLSQEHGVIRTDRKGFDSFRIGDTLGVLPVHSCLTANLAEQYHELSGRIIAKMRS